MSNELEQPLTRGFDPCLCMDDWFPKCDGTKTHPLLLSQILEIDVVKEHIESLLSKQKMQIEVKTGLKVFKIYQEEMSKQRAELVEKVREIGDTSDYPEWEGSAGINVGLIPKERVIALIKDTNEVVEEEEKNK